MSLIVNPEYQPHIELGETDASWDALKAIITSYLQANAGSTTITHEDVRALDPKFAGDPLWAQIASDLGLTLIPD